jgi:hypothetical protein
VEVTHTSKALVDNREEVVFLTVPHKKNLLQNVTQDLGVVRILCNGLGDRSAYGRIILEWILEIR